MGKSKFDVETKASRGDTCKLVPIMVTNLAFVNSKPTKTMVISCKMNEDDEMKFLNIFRRFIFGEQSCLAEQHPQIFSFNRWATD